METRERSHPQYPRPPAAEIDRVYYDLATVLSDAGTDAEGRRAVAEEALREQLKSAGHSLAAIDWAVHLFCENGLLRTTILKEKQAGSNRSGVREAKARTIDVPAISATDEFWDRWKTGSFSARQQELILLVHGIRTFGGWQSMVKRVLGSIPNTKVVEIKYGFLDSIRFWFPFFTRQFAINEVRHEIQNAKTANPNSQISIIAHSFGTYAISRILVEHPDLQLHKLILCGSIIPRTYRWNHVRGQLATDVINDFGTRDIWPVLAKCLSWGYGDTGRHGFGRGAYVTDRGHDFAHSDFFNDQFIENYWKPWFETDTVVRSAWPEQAPPPSWGLSILSVVPLQWILCVLMVAVLFTFGTRYAPGWFRENQIDPRKLPIDATKAVVAVTPLRHLDDAAIGTTDLIGKELLERCGVGGVHLCSSPDFPFGSGVHGQCDLQLTGSDDILVIHDLYVQVLDTFRAPNFHFLIAPPNASQSIEVSFMLSDFGEPLPATVRPRIVQIRGENKPVTSAFPIMLPGGGRASSLRLWFKSATPKIYTIRAFAEVSIGSDGNHLVIPLADPIAMSFFDSTCEFDNPMAPGNWYVPTFKEILDNPDGPEPGS